MDCFVVTPSPVAVTMRVVAPMAADGPHVKVSVLTPVEGERTTGLLFQEALTPDGSPETLKDTRPLKDPPPVIVNWLLIEDPRSKVKCEEDGKRFNVGEVRETFNPIPRVAANLALSELMI